MTRDLRVAVAPATANATLERLTDAARLLKEGGVDLDGAWRILTLRVMSEWDCRSPRQEEIAGALAIALTERAVRPFSARGPTAGEADVQLTAWTPLPGLGVQFRISARVDEDAGVRPGLHVEWQPIPPDAAP